MTVKDLRDHVTKLKTASEKDQDELLTELLCHCWQTRIIQDS